MAKPSGRQARRRSTHSSKRPSRRRSSWLHGLSTLLSVASQGERLAEQERDSPTELSSSGRRLGQRLELGQRLLNPLPAVLRSEPSQEQWLWRALRWGGGGLILAWWLLR
ncbi:hypothetical protein KQ304_09110 [Synechococcus sp. CS-1329]|jgi:hypothetical protein|uniref:hypothetical protein n=1 Tax=Synechococcus sp. CS-1329 TaxID=2847975 RepID=UPI00223B4E14|nr:hypothetical protein [Synechococcus sp. CS-1329]MCT0219156.1 hypothetical protein [Synechococcus sp. CS-1329]